MSGSDKKFERNDPRDRFVRLSKVRKLCETLYSLCIASGNTVDGRGGGGDQYARNIWSTRFTLCRYK